MSTVTFNKKKSSIHRNEEYITNKLRRILTNLSDYVVIGMILEERSENGDTYAKMLIEQVRK